LSEELTLSAALAAMRSEGAGWRAPVPDNWAQGRTAYGGYTAALLLGAALKGRDDLPPLRSALVNFTGPLSAPPLLSAEQLRRGRNVATLEVRAEVESGLAALGVFSFGAAQESHVSQDCPAPEAPAPEEAEPFFPPQARRFMPRFFDEFELRLVAGSRPFTGGERGLIRVWARHRDPEARARIEGLIGLADVLPPAVFARMTQVGPNSSVNWICNVLRDDLETRDGWFLVESELTVAREGYSSQVMRMWDSEGRLVVEGMQSVVVFV